MYGLISKIEAAPGQRDALAAILVRASAGLPGCVSYVVARDASESDALWVTEAWESSEHHAASLAMPAVLDAIKEGRPLIAGFSMRIETEPMGGVSQ